jgi:serine/threonine protein kinase
MENHVTFCPQANRLLDRGVEGEIRTARYLYEKLNPKYVGAYRALVNYNFPRHGANTLEIDLLVITTFGVFLLEVKNWVGGIKAYDDTWLCNGERRENIFGAASFKAKNIHSYLRSNIRRLPFDPANISVTSLLVLVRGTQAFENLSSYDSQAVVGLDQQLVNALSSTDLLHRRTNSQRLGDQDIRFICDVLYRRHQTEKEEIVEHYRLLKKVRSADLFEEFDAQNTHVASQYVRLKCYHLHTLANKRVTEKTIAHFKRDLEVVNSLGYHPNIVQTRDFFPDPKYYDLYYEVTESIDGKRLDELMAQRSQKDRCFSLWEQITILEALCSALQHAHNHQNANGDTEPVYHRNISSNTIFLACDSTSGRSVIKLADFDFAKFGKHTINPMHLGPEYRNKVLIQKVFTAPEVVRNASDARAYSDIYALGILWYFLAQLPLYDPTAPFDPLTDADKIDVLSLPEQARDLLKRMVAYKPDQRPQHVGEVLEILKLLKAQHCHPQE